MYNSFAPFHVCSNYTLLSQIKNYEIYVFITVLLLRKTRICSDFAQKIWPKYCSLRPLLAMYVNVSYSKLHHNMSLYLITYIMIIAPNIRSHATLLCGVPADAELLRPAMPVLVQNSWVNWKYFMLSNFIRSVPSKSITRHCLFPEGPCWVSISKAVVGV